MLRTLRPLAPLVFVACAPRLGHPRVHYGPEMALLPVVQPSTDSRRWYVPVDAGEAGSWVFFVDTGYTNSTCDDAFVEALGLVEKGHSRVYGELGSIRTGKAELPVLQIGGHRVEGLVCQTRDLASTSSISDPSEVPVAGVLGMDVFRHFRTRFDAGTGRIELLDPDREEPLAVRPNAVRLRREQLGFGLRAHLELVVDDHTTRTLVDTGATDTYIDGGRMGLEPSLVREGVTLRGTGRTSSTTVDVVHYDIDRVGLGTTFVGPVTLTDRQRKVGSPGLLGQDVLGLLRSDFDWLGGWAVFAAVRPADLPTWAAWSLEPDGDVIHVNPR